MPDPRNSSFSTVADTSAHLPPPNGVEHAPGEITALGFLNRVLRNRRLIVSFAAAGFLIMAVTSLLTPRTWSSTASFVPTSRQAKSGLAALAAQYGVQMSTDEPSHNPDFYVDLIRSRGVLTQLAQAKLEERTPSGVRTATVADRLEIADGAPDVRTERAIRALRGLIQTSVTLRTGMVNYTVGTREAKLSEQIASRLLELLNRFNVESRQQQASNERHFTEQRLAEVRVSLRAAEDKMVDFQLRNRIQAVADLQFQSDRLAREIQREHALYTTLEQAYEQARIDEVRDTPLLTVVDRPIVPYIPDGRGTIGKSLLGIILGALMGIFVGIVRDQFKTSENASSRRNAEYQEFATLRTQTLAEIRGLRHIFSRNNGRYGTTSDSSSPGRSETSEKH